MVKIILRDRYYIPLKAIDPEAVKKHLEVAVSTKNNCRPSCPIARHRNRFCSTCPSRNQKIKMWEVIESNSGKKWLAMPAGDSQLMNKIVRKTPTVIDRRFTRPMRSNLRWTGKLFRGELNADGEKTPNQFEMLSKWRKHVATGDTGGIVISPPRSGKCVVAGTILRTNEGYVPIEHLFVGRGCDVSEIGNFGTTSTPLGIADIRGIFTRLSSTITIFLDCGIKLGGTPMHPVQVMHKTEPVWCALEDLKIGDKLFFPRENDPVPDNQGLSEEVAALMGHIVACADMNRLRDGIVDLGELDDYAEADELIKLLYQATGIFATNRTVFELDKLHAIKHWQADLLASSQNAWRTFTIAAFKASFSETPSLMLPEQIARCLHLHLLGAGIKTMLTREAFSYVVVILDVDGAKNYFKGKATPPFLTGKVIKIVNDPESKIVYDIVVPQGRAFLSNGIASHNTVIGVTGVMSQRQRSFITASKIDFLRQFCKRFGDLTNLRELYRDGKRPVILIDPKGWKDGEKYGVLVLKKWDERVHKADVLLFCYQQLLDTKRGRQRLRKYINGKFGMGVGDEIHQAAAPCFSRVFNRINVRYKLGLTATLTRKDGLHPLALAVMGRVVVIGKTTSRLPWIKLVESGVGSGRTYKNWQAMESFLVKLEERNKIIVRQVFKDLREDKKHNILIATTRVNHIHTLKKLINEQAAYNHKHKGENWPTDLAVSYYGKSDTNEILNQVHAGRARVVVAMTSMVKYGLDVPQWTHVYVGIIPTSNPQNVYQLLNRVCTPYDKNLRKKLKTKPRSIVRFFIDEMSVSIYCFKRLFDDKEYGLKGMMTGSNYYGVKLIKMEGTTYSRAEEIARYPKSYKASDAGVKSILGKVTGRSRKANAWKPRLSGIKKL